MNQPLRIQRKKISSGLIFAGTATLGIASLAMPQLTLLSAAATGIGLAFGGKSLADIFSEHKAHKNEIQILEKHPYRFCMGHIKEIVILCIPSGSGSLAFDSF